MFVIWMMVREGTFMTYGAKATYTLAEAAELLSCHRETLRRAIRVGELRAAKLGREFRISRPDLEAFWAACGGGDLFDKNVPDASVASLDKMPSTGHKKKDKDAQHSQQLSLLEEVSQSSAPEK